MNRSARKSIERALSVTTGWVLVFVDRDTDALMMAGSTEKLNPLSHTHICLKSLVPSLAPLVRKVNARQEGERAEIKRSGLNKKELDDALREKLEGHADNAGASGGPDTGGEVAAVVSGSAGESGQSEGLQDNIPARG